MSRKPLVSIIVPVFNTEKYLRKCIDSVLTQDYENIELILINDGSTDGSGDICDEYRKSDNRVKVIHQLNRGASTARNAGLDNSTGDFIMFLDSDDYWVDSCLKKIINQIKDYDYESDVVFLNSAKIRDDGTLTDFKGYSFNRCDRNQLLMYLSKQDKIQVSACLKVINKRLFTDKSLYFDDSLLAEDIDWFFNLISTANNYTTFDGEFYCYRLLSNSASRSVKEKRIIDYLYILNKWVNKARESDATVRKHYYYMIGYEYEILLATFFNYSKEVRVKYFSELKSLFWLLEYRSNPRSKVIKLFKKLIGFGGTCRVMNFYLNNRVI